MTNTSVTISQSLNTDPTSQQLFQLLSSRFLALLCTTNIYLMMSAQLGRKLPSQTLFFQDGTKCQKRKTGQGAKVRTRKPLGPE